MAKSADVGSVIGMQRCRPTLLVPLRMRRARGAVAFSDLGGPNIVGFRCVLVPVEPAMVTPSKSLVVKRQENRALVVKPSNDRLAVTTNPVPVSGCFEASRWRGATVRALPGAANFVALSLIGRVSHES